VEVDVVVVGVAIVRDNRVAWNASNRCGEAVAEMDFESLGIG